MKEKTLILCGDKRSIWLCRLLKQAGEPAWHFPALPDSNTLKKEIADAGRIVLPTPVSRGETLSGDPAQTAWPQLFSLFSPKQHIFGGGFSAIQRDTLRQRRVGFTDFLCDPVFVRRNAALTAQGALRLLLEHTTTFLPQQRVLIAGYGNVAKETAALLRGIGCGCTVAARSDTQRQNAVDAGCEACSLEAAKRSLSCFDLFVNTIPSRWLDEDSLSGCKPGDLYLELASFPFGTTRTDCETCGLHYLDGKGLPGRFYPKAAAGAMKQCLESA